MKFRSVSPTALAVAGACKSRWYSENVIGGRGFKTPAADLGTACHSALEKYVQLAVMLDTMPATYDTLLSFFELYYRKGFPEDFDLESPLYLSGVDMMRTWHKRNNSWDKFEVISLEEKKTIMVPTSIGEVPCNFIIDRLDRIDEETIRVVDYKSWRKKLYPEDVRRTVQGKIYAVAAKILYPDVKRVLVVYDQLRYTEVGVYFEEEHLEAAWRFLTARTQQLVDLREEDITATVNPECGFCVKKNNCKPYRKHIEADGIHGFTTQQLIERAAELDEATKMIASARTEVELLLSAQVNNDEDRELQYTRESDGASFEARFKPTYSSWVLQEKVLELVGPEIFIRHATVGTADHKRMLDDPDLTPEQVEQLAKLKYRANKGEKLDVARKKD